MKLTKFASLLVIGLVLSVVATGCKSGKKGATPLPPYTSGGTTGGLPPGETMKPGEEVTTAGRNPAGIETASFNPDDFNQDRAALAAQTIYFDYDSATIKAGEQSKLETVAGALKSDMSAKLLIEGDCDERGTEEYNRSLGERRALAAREALAGLGIDPNRVATRSFGEDRPADPGHDQAAWSKNRRAEFILLHAK